MWVIGRPANQETHHWKNSLFLIVSQEERHATPCPGTHEEAPGSVKRKRESLWVKASSPLPSVGLGWGAETRGTSFWLSEFGCNISLDWCWAVIRLYYILHYLSVLGKTLGSAHGFICGQRRNMVTGGFVEADGERIKLYFGYSQLFSTQTCYMSRKNYKGQFEMVYLKPPLHSTTS